MAVVQFWRLSCNCSLLAYLLKALAVDNKKVWIFSFHPLTAVIKFKNIAADLYWYELFLALWLASVRLLKVGAAVAYLKMGCYARVRLATLDYLSTLLCAKIDLEQFRIIVLVWGLHYLYYIFYTHMYLYRITTVT